MSSSSTGLFLVTCFVITRSAACTRKPTDGVLLLATPSATLDVAPPTVLVMIWPALPLAITPVMARVSLAETANESIVHTPATPGAAGPNAPRLVRVIKLVKLMGNVSVMRTAVATLGPLLVTVIV